MLAPLCCVVTFGKQAAGVALEVPITVALQILGFCFAAC